MFKWLKTRVRRAYLRELKGSIEEPPTHVAVIQDGNRRYAREQGMGHSSGHEHGADTTEDMLHWCDEVGIREVTLYTLSTENFARPDDELEALFDLITDKLYQFADSDLVHDNQVQIRCLGDVYRLPQRVVDAVNYAEEQTEHHDQLQLNIALAYGGRNELLRTAKEIAEDVDAGTLTPEDVSVEEIESRLYDTSIREVDLIIRTGGDERTSNFLPWYANGNEAAVYFCTPYWPEFDKPEFFRAIRTYQSREQSWQEEQTHRAITLTRALAEVGYQDHKQVAARIRNRLARGDVAEVDDLTETDPADVYTHPETSQDD